MEGLEAITKSLVLSCLHCNKSITLSLLQNLKEITHLRHFLIFFTIQFFILFTETLIISQIKSWASQNNTKYNSEYA